MRKKSRFVEISMASTMIYLTFSRLMVFHRKRTHTYSMVTLSIEEVSLLRLLLQCSLGKCVIQTISSCREATMRLNNLTNYMDSTGKSNINMMRKHINYSMNFSKSYHFATASTNKCSLPMEVSSQKMESN